jgi:ABC-2 type transport system ATP-binding protein
MVEEEGVTVVLTTHNMHEAERLCDLIAVIRQGRLVTVDKPEKLMTEHVMPKLKIVATGITQEVDAAIYEINRVRRVSRKNGHIEVEFDGPIDAAPVVTVLVEHGVNVQEVRKSRATLEDVFLHLVNGNETEPEP